MSECANHSSCPWLQEVEDRASTRSARSFEPLPAILMSPGCVVSWTAVGPSRPGPTSVARVDAAASKYKPQSVGELVNSHDHTALGEIWAWAGCGDANTQIATAPAIARNKFMEPPVMKKMGLCYRSFCYWSFCYWSCTRNSNESRDCRAGLSLERRRLEGGLRQRLFHRRRTPAAMPEQTMKAQRADLRSRGMPGPAAPRSLTFPDGAAPRRTAAPPGEARAPPLTPEPRPTASYTQRAQPNSSHEANAMQTLLKIPDPASSPQPTNQ